MTPEEISEEAFSSSLYSAGVPDPDLIIRPSGEYRVSNFLLWQSAYSEYYFTDVLWPDFDKQELIHAIRAFQGRSRRFGGDMMIVRTIVGIMLVALLVLVLFVLPVWVMPVAVAAISVLAMHEMLYTTKFIPEKSLIAGTMACRGHSSFLGVLGF